MILKGRKVTKSPLKNKEYRVIVKGKPVDFGDPKMKEYPGTKRGDSYCARSSGIKGVKDITSPNYWSRALWRCKGKKSL